MAKARLKRMSVVMILEYFSGQVSQLCSEFGWTSFNTADPEWIRHGKSSTPPFFNFTKEEERFFQKANSLDYELYNFGKGLAWEKTRQMNKKGECLFKKR